MVCKWCNSEVSENAKFCTNCGGSISRPEYQTQNTINNQSQNTFGGIQQKSVNVGLVILSFFIPLAGLIIFLSKKDSDKQTAKISGIVALISFGISMLSTMILFGTVLSTAGKVMNTVGNEIKEQIEDDFNPPSINYDENEENSPIQNSNTNWRNYELSVNNVTLKLPCTYNDLSNATLAAMKDVDLNSTLAINYYALVNMYKENKLALSIEILNDTGANIVYKDGKVTRVSQTKYQVTNGSTEIIFPGGLKVGQEMTKEKLVLLFGEPSDIYNYTSDNYVSDTYSYVENTSYTTINYYKIKVLNGVIDELTIDHRNY